MSNRRYGRDGQLEQARDGLATDGLATDGLATDGLAGDADPAAPIPLLTIDALGRKCPIPIIMLAERIGEVPIGSVIAVLADDPAAENDVPAWCLMKSHDHVLTQPLERGWAILIRRGY